MIVGVGIDIVENDRVDERLASKILGENELKVFCEIRRTKREYLASRFAAKEAFFKDLQVMNDENGKPYYHFSEKIEDFLRGMKISEVHLSISHERNYSVAITILEKVV